MTYKQCGGARENYPDGYTKEKRPQTATRKTQRKCGEHQNTNTKRITTQLPHKKSPNYKHQTGQKKQENGAKKAIGATPKQTHGKRKQLQTTITRLGNTTKLPGNASSYKKRSRRGDKRRNTSNNIDKTYNMLHPQNHAPKDGTSEINTGVHQNRKHIKTK